MPIQWSNKEEEPLAHELIKIMRPEKKKKQPAPVAKRSNPCVPRAVLWIKTSLKRSVRLIIGIPVTKAQRLIRRCNPSIAANSARTRLKAMPSPKPQTA